MSLRSPFWISFCLALVGASLLLSSATRHLEALPAAQKHRFERALAERLRQGSAAIHRRSMDEQALKWHLAELAGDKTEVVVLGSSHSLPVAASMLPAGRFLNLSASGAGLAEQLVSDELLHESGARPRLKILVADPWLLDRGADFGKWRERLGQTEAACRRLTGVGADGNGYHPEERHGWQIQAWLDLGPMQTWFSDRTRLALFPPGELPGSASRQFLTIQADGSFRDADEATALGAEGSTALALQQYQSSPDRHRYGSYSTLDPQLSTLLKAWLEKSSQDGAKVWLLLNPYHPAIYGKMITKPDNRLIELEKRFRQLATDEQCDILGSYDPTLAGVTAEDFADGDHLNAKGLAKLLGKASPRDASLPKP